MDADGWFGTGDVASVGPDGQLIIRDRAKDLVKSGGEWISSIDLENAALSHPAIHACAVIAVAHPTWDERPVLLAVAAGEARPALDEMRAHMAPHFAEWQLPDDLLWVEDLPLTATGKVSKLTLRERFATTSIPICAGRAREHGSGHRPPRSLAVRASAGPQRSGRGRDIQRRAIQPDLPLKTPAHRYVLRRKPFGVLLKSAHAVEREFRVQRALWPTDVPVARMHVLCEDEHVIGAPFYVMDEVPGRNFDAPDPAGSGPRHASCHRR